MGLQKCGLNLNHTGKELQPHGTFEFPCAGYCAQYTERAEDAIPWHWHEEMEIVYLKTGGLKLQIPGETFHVPQGDGFVINSNVLHFAAAQPSCTLHSLVFNPLLVAGHKDSVYADKYITPLTNCTSFAGCLLSVISNSGISLASEFSAAFEALSSDLPGYEFVVREKLSHICFSLCQYFAQNMGLGDVERGPDSIRIQKMLDYIHTHFSQRLELSQIAKTADVGERECLRCFQRTIQIPPMQYLLKYRMMQGASMLLRNSSAGISDIAGQCGFDSPSNFSQMFKRFYKCTPREYRGKQKHSQIP